MYATSVEEKETSDEVVRRGAIYIFHRYVYNYSWHRITTTKNRRAKPRLCVVGQRATRQTRAKSVDRHVNATSCT